VTEARFGDPVRPSTVIINNATIMSRTTVIAGIKHDTRTVAGAGPQRVVINQGPAVGVVQKASGKTFKPMPIHEAVRQTSVPSSVSGNSLKPTGRDVPRVAPDQPRVAPQPQPVPGLRPEQGKDRFERPDQRPPRRGNDAGRPAGPPREPGRDKEEEHGHDKGGR
jgi:hypothetical protein